jgi:hypothetical protein
MEVRVAQNPPAALAHAAPADGKRPPALIAATGENRFAKNGHV